MVTGNGIGPTYFSPSLPPVHFLGFGRETYSSSGPTPPDFLLLQGDFFEFDYLAFDVTEYANLQKASIRDVLAVHGCFGQVQTKMALVSGRHLVLVFVNAAAAGGHLDVERSRLVSLDMTATSSNVAPFCYSLRTQGNVVALLSAEDIFAVVGDDGAVQLYVPLVPEPVISLEPEWNGQVGSLVCAIHTDYLFCAKGDSVMIYHLDMHSRSATVIRRFLLSPIGTINQVCRRSRMDVLR
jgi:hypothetical protein